MADDDIDPLLSGPSSGNIVDLNNSTASPITQSESVSQTPQLSKNAQKRALKQEKWESLRDARREKRKEKLKEKKTKLRLAGERLPPRKKPPVEGQENSGVKVVIDCAFDDWMIDKEIVSLSSQLTRCHAENRKAVKTVDLYISSLNDRLKDRMETSLDGMHHRWKGVEVSALPYLSVLPDIGLTNFVYLTADSDNIVTSLEPDKVYIIGGIVDKNRHKGLCYNKALKEGIQHGKLPIGDYIQMASRHVLTVNQVFEIMLEWLKVQDWEKAFMHVIPKRKLAATKKDTEDQDKDDEDDEDEENEADAEIEDTED